MSTHQVASETKSMKQPTWVFVEKESVTDLREQILQLIEHDCHDQKGKSQAELLEKLNRCKRDTLIELCRSFDVIGSRANRKEELVSFLMEFVKDQASGIDGINSDKKFKKRRRVKEEENLATGKPSKKKKREGEEEADKRKGVEDRVKLSDCDLMDNEYSCTDTMNGKYPNEQTNFEPSERMNGPMSENLDGTSISEVPISTDQQVISTPPTKLVTAAEGDSTDVKALKRKMSSTTKKIATPKEDCKVKFCGKREYKGDTKPRKPAIKPSKDELREAVFLILDTADFATMTFGDVVKEVDKYFGKDLFERKPLIRSLIEEELFRLAEEAEKKELEEEKGAEGKARAEQAAKEMAQVQTVESGINKQNVIQADRDGNTKGSSKDANDSSNKKVIDCTFQSNGEADTTMNNNVETQGGSKDGKVKGASNGENNDTEDGRNAESRSGNVGSNAEAVHDNHGSNELVEHKEDGNAQEANNGGNTANVEIHGDEDGKAEDGSIIAEQSQAYDGSNGKAEDVGVGHNENTKVDADSRAAENGKADVDVKGNSNGMAEGNPV